MQGANESFQLTLGDFSGPLDLLCHLVESRSIDASSVKLTEVLSQYVAYMLTAKKATLSELAEFFSLASVLLLRKVRSLMPGPDREDGREPHDADCDADALGDEEPDEERLKEMLERFKPYRAAALVLSSLKESRERFFTRVSDESGPPWFDIGDLYGLATLWWRLIKERSRHRAARTESVFMADIPDAVPEEILVEQRMGDILRCLGDVSETSLGGLISLFGNGELVVTLLALLELSRLGKVSLSQNGVWEDVLIAAA
ncbi:MAG: segregation/condensation protein A [Synergistaceae bacterium]|jgi:segregation and condensation protein A|nr:segregation/condensation protein A [Synergistaceae bacterium]